MARQKIVEEPLAPIDPIEDDLIDVLNQIPGDSRSIQVWRMHATGRPKFLNTLAPVEFSIEALKEKYGGGKFRLSFPVEGVRVERILEIDGPPIIEIVQPWSNTRQELHQAPIPQGLDPFQTAIIQELRDLKKSSNGNGNDQMTTVLLQIIANQSKSDDKALEQLIKYRTLFAPNQSSVDANTILSSLKMGLEIGGDGLGMSEAKNPWLALAEKILPMVATVLTKVQPTQPAIGPDGIPLEALNPPNGVAPASSEPKTGFAAVADHLRPHLPTFINAAARDVDPAILVELALPMIPDNQKVAVLDWLKDESWFTDLCSLSPIIAGQQSWWNDFAGAMIESLSQPATSEET